MGFRCPLCKEDFGINYEEFQNHLKNNSSCRNMSQGIKIMIDSAIDGKSEEETIEDFLLGFGKR